MPRIYDVLVTGGAGFIGSNLVDALVESGRSVQVLDNLSTGNERNLAQAGKTGRVRISKADVTNRARVERLLRSAPTIVHLAAESRAVTAAKYPERTNKVNGEGTLNLLQAARTARASRFVLASSAGVYGESERPVQNESDTPKPISVYGASKLAAEAYCAAFNAQFQLPTCILRLFNVYGPRQAATEEAAVISKFMRRIGRGLAPQIYGDGQQTRDFVHVRDVVAAIIRSLEVPETAGQVINVGTGVRTSVLELAGLMSSLLGSANLTPQHLPARTGDIRNSCADVQRMQRILGLHARVGLREGLAGLAQAHVRV
jgi:UDP-glucose 4-epimerase